MESRNKVLKKLRQAQTPFEQVKPIEEHRHMVPLSDTMTQDEMVVRFTEAAQKLSCYVYQVSYSTAFEQIMELIGEDKTILSWDEKYIPYDGLHAQLANVGVNIGDYDDRDVRVGITGGSSALSATGSLVLSSGPGQYRTTSLLPDLLIALITPQQVVADFETWQKAQQANGYPAFTEPSNTVIISGPSKTADIAQELIKGAHGPREVHIMILVDKQSR